MRTTQPRSTRSTWRAALALAALLALAACGGNVLVIQGVSVEASDTRVGVGVTVDLEATVAYTGGDPLAAPDSVTFGVAPTTGGSLSTTGPLAATFVATAAGTYTITATSVDDATKTDNVEVLVEIATRVNAGGDAYVALDGRVFAADADAALFTDGVIYPPTDEPANPIRTADIAGTDDDELYRSERSAFGTVGGAFGYAIPVPLVGEYRVVLHFAEIYWRAVGGDPDNGAVGTRVFDVAAEGALVLDDYDLFVEAAADVAQTAFVESFVVAVADGTLDLTFTSVAPDAKVSAIEVVYVGP